MTREEQERVVREVVGRVPALKGHEQLVRKLIEHVVAQGAGVSVRSDGAGQSSVKRPNRKGEKGAHIRVDIGAGADCLWDFAHEAGHLDEPAKNVDACEQLAREIRAWEVGWEVLVEMDATIVSSKRAYENRRNACLASYRAAAAAHGCKGPGG